MVKPSVIDSKQISEEQAIKMFGKDINRFMKAVRLAAKRHGIEAYALWMYKYGTMRVCSTGIDETGRTIGLNVANRMADVSRDVMDTMAKTLETKGNG